MSSLEPRGPHLEETLPIWLCGGPQTKIFLPCGTKNESPVCNLCVVLCIVTSNFPCTMWNAMVLRFTSWVPFSLKGRTFNIPENEAYMNCNCWFITWQESCNLTWEKILWPSHNALLPYFVQVFMWVISQCLNNCAPSHLSFIHLIKLEIDSVHEKTQFFYTFCVPTLWLVKIFLIFCAFHLEESCYHMSDHLHLLQFSKRIWKYICVLNSIVSVLPILHASWLFLCDVCLLFWLYGLLINFYEN